MNINSLKNKILTLAFPPMVVTLIIYLEVPNNLYSWWQLFFKTNTCLHRISDVQLLSAYSSMFVIGAFDLQCKSNQKTFFIWPFNIMLNLCIGTLLQLYIAFRPNYAIYSTRIKSLITVPSKGPNPEPTWTMRYVIFFSPAVFKIFFSIFIGRWQEN